MTKNKQASVNSSLLYYFYAAASTTGIAGILHLRIFSMGLDRGINEIGIFFLVSGVIRLFWVIPMIRHWGGSWYYVGLVGTGVLIIMWAMTRVLNPITHGMSITNKFYEHCNRAV